MRGQLRRNQRGQAVSVFICVVIAAMIITAGLVVDGGQQIAAATRAEVAAAGAARAATDASATNALAGQSGAGPAVLAARSYLAGQPGVTGSVEVSGGVVTVRTAASEPTVFLSAIGIGSVQARGAASAVLVATGDR